MHLSHKTALFKHASDKVLLLIGDLKKTVNPQVVEERLLGHTLWSVFQHSTCKQLFKTSGNHVTSNLIIELAYLPKSHGR